MVDDSYGLTKLIFEVVKKSGQRALVSKGWEGSGANNVPAGVFMLGNVSGFSNACLVSFITVVLEQQLLI